MSEPTSDQPATVVISSHKRTSSTAENTETAPSIKRRTEEPSQPSTFSLPQNVYIVHLDMTDPYQSDTSDIQGVYAALKDANNAVRRIACDYGLDEENSDQGTEDDGRVYCSTDDSGEGGTMEIYSRIWEVKPPGSEEDVEFLSAGEDESEGGSEDVEEEEEE